MVDGCLCVINLVLLCYICGYSVIVWCLFEVLCVIYVFLDCLCELYLMVL